MRHILKLAGQPFEVLSNPPAMAVVRWAELVHDSGLGLLRQRDGEPARLYSRRVHARLMREGLCFQLMAACVAPAGEPWDLPQARETADFLASLRGTRDQQLLLELLQHVIARLLRRSDLKLWYPGGLN